MHLAADNNRKGMIYRAWAPGFFNPDASVESQCKSRNFEGPPPSLPMHVPSAPTGELTTARKMCGRETVAALPCRNLIGNGILGNQEEVSCEPRNPEINSELALVVHSEEKGVLSERSYKTPKSGVDKRYPRLSLTPDCIRREQRILDLVQVLCHTFFLILVIFFLRK